MKKIILILCILTSTASYAQNALTFDGAGDCVTTPLTFSTQPQFTYEGWIYLTSLGPSVQDVFGANGGSEIVISSTDIRVWIGSTGSQTIWSHNSTTFPLNMWHHLAVTGDGSNIKIYVDGILKQTQAGSTGNYGSGTQFKMGAAIWAGANDFSGTMDEVRVWSTARTQAEIKNNMFGENLSAGQTGLVAHYKFNEGSGTTAINSCTNTSGIDGNLTGGPAWVASPIYLAANALHFDGTDDRVSVPTGYPSTDNLTYEVWLNPSILSGNRAIIDYTGWAAGYVHFQLNTNTIEFAVNGTTAGSYNSTFSISTPGIWYHIAVTYSKSDKEIKFYVNGNLTNTASFATAPTIAGSVPFNIGSYAGTDRYFPGTIDEVRIWNTTRTAAEILANYNVEISPTTAGLVSYYTFNQGVTSGTNTGLISVVDKTSNNNGTLTNSALTGSTSNYVAGKTDLFVLPVTWYSFTAKKQNNQAELNWATVSEQNSKDFLVQHSRNTTDWNTIGNVLAAGNSNSIKNYSYNHSTPEKGKNYYRLLQRDNDGKSSFSQICMLNFETKQKSITLLENPVPNGQLRFLVNTATMVSFYNNEGKLLWKKQMATGTHTINVAGYAKGIYLVKTEIETQQIVID